jgi:hypothetical protein
LGILGSGLELMCTTALLNGEEGKLLDDGQEISEVQSRSRDFVCLGSAVGFFTLNIIRLMHGGDEKRIECNQFLNVKSKYSFYCFSISSTLQFYYWIQVGGQFFLSGLSFSFSFFPISTLPTLVLLALLSSLTFLMMITHFMDEAIVVESRKIHSDGRHEIQNSKENRRENKSKEEMQTNCNLTNKSPLLQDTDSLVLGEEQFLGDSSDSSLANGMQPLRKDCVKVLESVY